MSYRQPNLESLLTPSKIPPTFKVKKINTETLSEEEPKYYFDIINGEHIYPKLSEETLNYLLGDDDDNHGRGPVDNGRGQVDDKRGQVDDRRGPVNSIRQPHKYDQLHDDVSLRGPVNNVRDPVNDGRSQANSRMKKNYNEISQPYDDDIVSDSYNKSELYSGTPLSKKKGFFKGKIHKIYKIGKNLHKSDIEILNSYVAKLLVLKYIIIKYECLFKLAEIIYAILTALHPNTVILTNFYNEIINNEMISGKDNNTNKNYIFVDDENKTFNVELNIFTYYIEYIINNRKKSKEKINEIKRSIEIFNDKDIKIYNIKSIINKQISFISAKLYYYITDYIINLYVSKPNILKFKKKINKYIKFNDSNYYKFLIEIKKNREMNIKKKSNNFDFDVDEKSSNNIIKKFINKDIEKFLQFISDIIDCMKIISLSLYGQDQKMYLPDKIIDMKMYFHSTQFSILTLISDYIKNKDKYYLP
jgi:hypothetical protein